MEVSQKQHLGFGLLAEALIAQLELALLGPAPRDNSATSHWEQGVGGPVADWVGFALPILT